MTLTLQRGGQMRIGVDLGGTKIEFAAIADDNRILARNRTQTPAGDYLATIDAVRDGVLALEREIGQSGSVGVGIPGSLSPSTGKVRNANSTCLFQVRFQGIPVQAGGVGIPNLAR